MLKQDKVGGDIVSADAVGQGCNDAQDKADWKPGTMVINGRSFKPPFVIDENPLYGDVFLEDGDGTLLLVVRGSDRTEYTEGLFACICRMLNRPAGVDASERRGLLSLCCDVVRNTNMDPGLRSHLINTFMRL